MAGWIKLHRDLVDSKRLRSETRRNGPLVAWVWVAILTQTDADGRLVVGGHPMQSDDLADIASVSFEEADRAIAVLLEWGATSDLGWLVRDQDGCLRVKGWKYRQFCDSTLRVRKFREARCSTVTDDCRYDSVTVTPFVTPKETPEDRIQNTEDRRREQEQQEGGVGGTPVSCEDGQDAPAELATTDSPCGSAAAPASRRQTSSVSLDRETWTIHGLTTEHLDRLGDVLGSRDDVEDEVRRAAAWCAANPAKAPRTAILRFLTSWMSRSYETRRKWQKSAKAALVVASEKDPW